MKYLVIIPDGMADNPVVTLGNKTPLEYADTPNMDKLSSYGVTGKVCTVPATMVPESDTANLAIMGYNPEIYSNGRSPLEALSMGITLLPNQTAIRTNLAAISDEENIPYEKRKMLDHSSDEISTEEAKILVEYLEKKLFSEYGNMHLYTGVSYRHCLVFDDAPDFVNFARPHDIIGKVISEYLPKCEIYRELMEKSFDLLNNHPINIKRKEKGLKKANTVWFWSPGKKPELPKFYDIFGLKGSVICAVDLIKGIGKCAGLDTPAVPGATGGTVTDYSAKANAAISEFASGKDFVYIHIEAPDECGHKGDAEAKATAISEIDKKIVGKVTEYFEKNNEAYRLLVLPDHYTPVSARTHAHGNVPFFIYDSSRPKKADMLPFSENNADKSGIIIKDGYTLMKQFILGAI